MIVGEDCKGALWGEVCTAGWGVWGCLLEVEGIGGEDYLDCCGS